MLVVDGTQLVQEVCAAGRFEPVMSCSSHPLCGSSHCSVESLVSPLRASASMSGQPTRRR